MASGMNWRDDGSQRELQIISSGHMLVQHFQQTVRFFRLACLFSTLRFFATQVGMTRQDHNNTHFSLENHSKKCAVWIRIFWCTDKRRNKDLTA